MSETFIAGTSQAVRNRGRTRHLAPLLAGTAALALGLGLAPQAALAAPAPTAATTPSSVAATTTANGDAASGSSAAGQVAAKPYMGWSSWSLQSTNYPGVNPTGPGSFISEANILQQADTMAAKLKPFGYEYVNIDAGWQDGSDHYGRPTANPARFPSGMASVGEHIHKLGLKMGIYTVVGLGKDAYNEGKTPIYQAPGCTTKDIVYPDLRTTNGWDMSYKIDYASPCAQKYADSITSLFASWGVDFIKMDGVGPGSFKGGPNYDNTEDIKAWHAGIGKTGRPMQYIVSWAVSHNEADVWKANTNGWRVDTDVECYCNTIVKWDESVKQRWNDVVQWIDDAGPGHWNNLDAVNVGNGEMDGLTDAERQSYMTLWSIESAPLYIGDDLTKLDDYGLSLLTNREAIAINQAGKPARPVDQKSGQQTWYAKNDDGGVTVALFNLSDTPATVKAKFSDVGIGGPAKVHDVWAKQNAGTKKGSISATLPAHGSKLYTITPTGVAAGKPLAPTGVRATAAQPNSVSLAWHPSPSTDSAQPVTYRVYMDGREVGHTTSTTFAVAKLNPSSRHSFTVRAESGRGSSGQSSVLGLTLPAAGGPTVHEAEAPKNTLTGNASRGGCSGCSGGGKVGNLGGDGTLAFADINAPVAGNYLVTVGYVDADASRQGVLTVNGKAIQMNFNGSNDDNWDKAQQQQILVPLKAGKNKVTFSSPGSNGPDIDAITL